MTVLRIGLIGDFDPTVTAHQAIPLALSLAAQSVGRALEPTWIHTATLGRDTSQQLSAFAALWCVPASPYENEEGALAAIRFARESGRPYLGTCGGFQHTLLEYARNVLGLRHAEHAETRPDTAMPLIAPLSCALVEQTGTIAFEEGSRLRRVYGAAEVEEEFHCRYGLNRRYEKLLEGTALRICGRDRTGEVRAVELNGHPFFIATLFQPERAALRRCSHPLVTAYVAAAASCSESA
jgi:CTP synthase (UTP-ammonia lyase)